MTFLVNLAKDFFPEGYERLKALPVGWKIAIFAVVALVFFAVSWGGASLLWPSSRPQQIAISPMRTEHAPKSPTVAPPPKVESSPKVAEPIPPKARPKRNVAADAERKLPVCTPEMLAAAAKLPPAGVANVGSSVESQVGVGPQAITNLCSSVGTQRAEPAQPSPSVPAPLPSPGSDVQGAVPLPMKNANGTPCTIRIGKFNSGGNFFYGPPGAPNPFSPPPGSCIGDMKLTDNFGNPMQVVGVAARNQTVGGNGGPLTKEQAVVPEFSQGAEWNRIDKILWAEGEEWLKTNELPPDRNWPTAALEFVNQRLAVRGENFRVRTDPGPSMLMYYSTPPMK